VWVGAFLFFFFSREKKKTRAKKKHKKNCISNSPRWCTEIKPNKTETAEKERNVFFPAVVKENERCYGGRQ
jgi:hypothetical protein